MTWVVPAFRHVRRVLGRHALIARAPALPHQAYLKQAYLKPGSVISNVEP